MKRIEITTNTHRLLQEFKEEFKNDDVGNLNDMQLNSELIQSAIMLYKQATKYLNEKQGA